MRKTSLFVSTILLCVAGLFTDCSKKEDLIVATVGREKIAWAEFKEGYLKSPQFRRFREDSSAKYDYLNTLIQKKLMIKEAYRQGLDKIEEIQNQIENTESGLIVRELWEREIVDNLISESEMRDFYNHSAQEIRARHILIKAPAGASDEARKKPKAKADSLLTLIQEGHDFAMLAEKNSEDPGSATKGGDLGFFGWGKMVDEFQKVAFTLQPGQVSDVVETQYGYHIIKLEEKREVELDSYEEMKPQIRNQLQGRLKSELQRKGEEYVNNLKNENKLNFNDESLALISDKKKKGRALADSLIEAEKSAILVSYKDGEMTIADYLEWELTLPPKARAQAKDPRSIQRLLEGKFINEFLIKKAKNLGLDKAEHVANRIRERREELMVQELNKKIENSVQVTVEDIQSYFKEHKEEYILPEQVNIREIQVKEKTLAENLLQRMKKGADIASLAEEYSERNWAAKKGGEFGFFSEDQYGPIGREAIKLKVGEFGGPLKVQQGYSVFKVIDRTESRPQTFDEVRTVISTKLETERKEAAFGDFVTSLKEKTTIDINLPLLTMKVTEEES